MHEPEPNERDDGPTGLDPGTGKPGSRRHRATADYTSDGFEPVATTPVDLAKAPSPQPASPQPGSPRPPSGSQRLLGDTILEGPAARDIVAVPVLPDDAVAELELAPPPEPPPAPPPGTAGRVLPRSERITREMDATVITAAPRTDRDTVVTRLPGPETTPGFAVARPKAARPKWLGAAVAGVAAIAGAWAVAWHLGTQAGAPAATTDSPGVAPRPVAQAALAAPAEPSADSAAAPASGSPGVAAATAPDPTVAPSPGQAPEAEPDGLPGDPAALRFGGPPVADDRPAGASAPDPAPAPRATAAVPQPAGPEAAQVASPSPADPAQRPARPAWSHEVVGTAADAEAPFLALRDAPDGAAGLVAELPDGTRLDVRRADGRWREVVVRSGPDAGRRGWVHARWLRAR